MVGDYIVREEDIDLMHDVRVDMSLEDLIDAKIAQIVGIAKEQTRELQNLIDFILSKHTLDEITDYANELQQRLKEDE